MDVRFRNGFTPEHRTIRYVSLQEALAGGDFFGEFLILRRVEVVEAGPEDGDGAAFGGEGALVGGGVDAAGEAAVDREAGVGELVGEFFRALGRVVAGLPRADDADAVRQAFAQGKVALVRADWTRRDPVIGAALAALGRDGVPVYVLYRPDKAPLLLSELLSKQEVLAAIGTLQSS